ncbi:MAG: DMT family transporter [Cyanobacteria bacterium J06632_22]
MALHQSSGRWQLGLALAILPVVLWSLLPIGLAVVLEPLDVYTITWFRFGLSGGLLLIYLAVKGQLPTRATLAKVRVEMVGIAIAALTLNYLTFVAGLDRTSPANAEVIIQLAPMLLLLGGVVIFRERFSRIQALGVGGLMVGLLLFFNEQLAQWQAESDQQGTAYVVGGGLIVVAALAWAIYALLQKQLLAMLTSNQVMLLIFGGCALMLTPMAQPQRLPTLTQLEWGMLLFCGLNTLLAYGAFAASLHHLEASRISAILSLTPLVTIAAMALTHTVWPDLVEPERLTLLSLAGAMAVVVGSLMTALGQRERQNTNISKANKS